MTRFNIAAAFLAFSFVISGCCEPLPPKKPTVPKPPVVEVDTEPEPPPPVDIPFVILPADKSGSVSFRFVFDTGSSEDPATMRGIANLTATLMAQGGTTDLTYPELTQALFPMAAEIGLHVGRDQTVFYGRVHADMAQRYYSLMRDVLVNPRLDQKGLNRVMDKTKTALTLSLRGNDDEELGKAALALKMYGDHPYGPPTLGTEAGLSAITLDDVRVHRATTFCASRLTVGLCGNIPEDLEERIREDMKDLPGDCEERAQLPESPEPNGREVLLVDKPGAESTAISIGFPLHIRRGDQDYAALKLVEAYFGQHRTFSGKLQEALRVQRGFNYGNYAYVEHFEQEGWSRVPKTNLGRRQQHFSIWIRPVGDQNKHFVLRMAISELDALVQNGITQEVLDRTRTFMKRYYLTFAQTEQQRLGFAIDDRFYGQDSEYFETLFAALDKLTVEIVNTAIKKHLTSEKLFIAMVTKDAEKLADAIAADTPSPVTYESAKPKEVTEHDNEIQSIGLSIPRDSITIIPVNKIFE